MYRIYLGKFYFFYKHKQFFVLPFCCVGLVVLIRVSVRVRFRVRVRVKITAGRGGCGLVWNDYVCIRRARSAHQLDSDILVSAKLQLYPTFLYFDLYLDTAYAAHYVYFTVAKAHFKRRTFHVSYLTC